MHATKSSFFFNSEWHFLDVQILHGKTTCSDVAVLVPEHQKQLGKMSPINHQTPFEMGQGAYFLGFPYGMGTKARGPEGGNLRVPIIKHAYMSGAAPCSAFFSESTSQDQILLLDGFNNPGFSGGPVILERPGTKDTRDLVVAVISGFRPEVQQVMLDGKPTSNLGVLTNTGIILAVPIDNALSLIRDFKAAQAAK